MLRALDLFCGGGGAALGLFQAGFDEVVGIDIKDHSRVYPGHFILGDALKPPVRLKDFDFVWASPPCQAFSAARQGKNLAPAINLIPETREMIVAHPFTCIENVPSAPIRKDLVLSGPTFYLDKILRRRHFELSFFAWQPHLRRVRYANPPFPIAVMQEMGYNDKQRAWFRERGLKLPSSAAFARSLLGIETEMTRQEAGEAVPPAYAKYIGEQAIQRMELAA